MTSTRPFYDLANFAEGASVRIADPAVLKEFLRTWKLHHKLEPEQLRYAGQVAKVERVLMYHGGDIIYKLEDIPGLWHQHLLESVE